jgi:hypothetical protein
VLGCDLIGGLPLVLVDSSDQRRCPIPQSSIWLTGLYSGPRTHPWTAVRVVCPVDPEPASPICAACRSRIALQASRRLKRLREELVGRALILGVLPGLHELAVAHMADEHALILKGSSLALGAPRTAAESSRARPARPGSPARPSQGHRVSRAADDRRAAAAPGASASGRLRPDGRRDDDLAGVPVRMPLTCSASWITTHVPRGARPLTQHR